VRNIAITLALLTIMSCSGHADTSDCRDTVVIDSVSYRIPESWCPRWVDSTRWADPVKLVQVPERYTYEDYRIYLTRTARDAFVRMADAANADSIDLIIDSGYRSPDFQRRIIKRRLKKGEPFERIVRHVAPPGFSEHHTGRAFDLVPSEAAFAFTPAYAWLKENAARFGFRETYPKDQDENGLWWESWHWYYVGESALSAN